MNPTFYLRDVEAAPDTNDKSQPKSKLAFYEAASLLVVFSLLVINEGTVRFIETNPAGTDNFLLGRPPAIISFLAALFEIVFGILGLFLGLSGLVLKTHNPFLTKVAMFVQSVLGWYVFIVYVFLRPSFNIVDLSTPLTPNLSLIESKVVLALGILTSLSFCLALQGGQFAFMSRMLHADGKSGTSSRNRAIFWNANLALAGVWTTATGVIVNIREGSELLSSPFVSPPNVGRLAILTIATGALMLLWGLVGMAMSISRNMKFVDAYVAATGFVYVVMFLNYTIVQLGLLPNGPAGAASLHAGLVFLTVFIGPYFLKKQSEEFDL